MVKCVFDKAAVLECRWLKVFDPSATPKPSASSRSFAFCFCNIWLCDLSFNSYNLLKYSHANLNIVSIHNLTLLSQPHFWFVRTFFFRLSHSRLQTYQRLIYLKKINKKKNYQQNAFNQSRLAKSYFVFCFAFLGGFVQRFRQFYSNYKQFAIFIWIISAFPCVHPSFSWKRTCMFLWVNGPLEKNFIEMNITFGHAIINSICSVIHFAQQPQFLCLATICNDYFHISQ